MFKYFFSYYKDIPKQFRRELFDIQQVVALMVVIVICFFLIYTYRQATVKKKWKVIRILSFILPFMEIAQMIWYKNIGQFSLGYTLPLHLCSLMCIIMPVMAITKSPLLMEYCYAMGLAPALLALITPDVYFYPAISFIYIQTIIVHGVICIIPVFMIAAMGFRPSIRNLPKVIAMLIGLAVAIIPINHFTNGNYFFLRYPAPGSIMEIFADIFGKPGYLVPTFLLGCIMWTVLYAPFTFMGFKTGKRQKNEGQQSAAERQNATERQKVSEHKNTIERQKVSEHKKATESHNVSETQLSTEQHKETALR